MTTEQGFEDRTTEDGLYVRIRDVKINYPSASGQEEGFVAAVDLNVDVPVGQIVAIVGRSGCGKTSLLNAVAGLLPGCYDGEITVRGRAPEKSRRELGYMFARDALLPWRSAARNVELPLERRTPRRERRSRAVELLRQVGLAGFEKNLPHELSQGMRQRVALARTLSTNPALILADEPFAALDAQTKFRVQATFLREWEDANRTVILVTHDLQEAILLADRVIIMAGRPGRIAADQLVDLPRPRADGLVEIFTTDGFREMYHTLFGDIERAEDRSEIDDAARLSASAGAS